MSHRSILINKIQKLIGLKNQWKIKLGQTTFVPILTTSDPDKVLAPENEALVGPINLFAGTYLSKGIQQWRRICNIQVIGKELPGQNICYLINTEAGRQENSHSFYIYTDDIQGSKPVYFVYSQNSFQEFSNYLVQQPWSNTNQKVFDYHFYGLINAQTLINVGQVLDFDYPNEILNNTKKSDKYDSLKYTLYSRIPHTANESVDLIQYSITIQTPLLHDIAAAHYKYGPNTSYNSGDSGFSFNAKKAFTECIWDPSGTDKINVNNQKHPAIIDLRGGDYFSSVGVSIKDNKKPAIDNLTIAYGATIENADMTKFNDIITLNWANNIINDRKGNDEYRIFDKHLVTSITQGNVTQELKQGSGNNLIKDKKGENLFVFYFSKKSNALHFNFNEEEDTLTIQDVTNNTTLNIWKYSKSKAENKFAFKFYDDKYLDTSKINNNQSFEDIAIKTSSVLPKDIAAKTLTLKKLIVTQKNDTQIGFSAL